MGRKTLESLPGGKPLKNRVNIVMTRDKNYKNNDVIVCRTRTELRDAVSQFDGDSVFLIGGASVYNELMDCCTEAFVTRTFAHGGADKFINPLDGRAGWSISGESKMMYDGDTPFKFVTYKNSSVKDI